tara:strand:- start:145 stop:486 length:342 start_codon:yes stop_codon:yes gene_type:complete
MADEGTLATTAQVLLAIGENASATQILEANTNYWILYAESIMSSDVGYDLVTNYATLTDYWKQMIAMAAASKAAIFGLTQNQNTWQLATTQSKLNVLNTEYREAMEIIRTLTA